MSPKSHKDRLSSLNNYQKNNNKIDDDQKD